MKDSGADDQGPRTAFQRFLDWCVPPEARQDKRWMGWLLWSSLALLGAGALGFLAYGIFAIDAMARHGAGPLEGQASYVVGGASDFSRGIAIARWWLFGLLSVAPISIFRLWWHFGRADRPMSVHGDLKAAQAGDAKAALRLGLHYQERDPPSARAWLAQAAHAGEPEAMVALARDLREGRGGPRDLASAWDWLLRASVAGTPDAKRLLAEVEAQLGNRHSEQGV